MNNRNIELYKNTVLIFSDGTFEIDLREPLTAEQIHTLNNMFHSDRVDL